MTIKLKNSYIVNCITFEIFFGYYKDQILNVVNRNNIKLCKFWSHKIL